jgi:diacylglycerol kinase family enzyme
MIRINNSYAVNACTFGLEGLAGANGLTPSLSAVLKRSFRSVRIKADGIALDAGSVFLFTIANGRYASGGLNCSPQALNDDGKLDLCAIRNMPPTRLMRVLQALASGTLADEPAFAGDFVARKAKSYEVECAKDITISLDGLSLTGKEFKARVIPGAVSLVVPAG